MKKFIIVSLVFSLIGCSPVFAANEKKEVAAESPRITDLSKTRKKAGADDLVARAKNANTVAALKQIILDLIQMETGAK